MLLIAYSIRANAHEFWIEPTQYQLNDDLINAHLRVGQKFQGMVLMYNPQDFKTFKDVLKLAFKCKNKKTIDTILKNWTEQVNDEIDWGRKTKVIDKTEEYQVQ